MTDLQVIHDRVTSIVGEYQTTEDCIHTFNHAEKLVQEVLDTSSEAVRHKAILTIRKRIFGAEDYQKTDAQLKNHEGLPEWHTFLENIHQRAKGKTKRHFTEAILPYALYTAEASRLNIEQVATTIAHLRPLSKKAYPTYEALAIHYQHLCYNHNLHHEGVFHTEAEVREAEEDFLEYTESKAELAKEEELLKAEAEAEVAENKRLREEAEATIQELRKPSSNSTPEEILEAEAQLESIGSELPYKDILKAKLERKRQQAIAKNINTAKFYEDLYPKPTDGKSLNKHASMGKQVVEALPKISSSEVRKKLYHKLTRAVAPDLQRGTDEELAIVNALNDVMELIILRDSYSKSLVQWQEDFKEWKITNNVATKISRAEKEVLIELAKLD